MMKRALIMNVSEESDELLSVAKNASTNAFQILRVAQDDTFKEALSSDYFIRMPHP